MKPPPQSATKDQNSQHPGLNGRKASISHRDSAFVSSPTTSRPGTRRRETSDSVSLASPSGTGRFSRDDTGPISPFFGRKISESAEDRTEDNDRKLPNPFGGLMRSNTAGNPLNSGQATPWGAAAPSSSTMGSFGSFAMPNATTSNEKRPAFGGTVSRFANLMSKESIEDLPMKSSDAGQKSWRSRPRTDTDPYGGDDSGPSGSAALGDEDRHPPILGGGSGMGTPSRQTSADLGMSDIPGFRDVLRREQTQQTPHGHQDRDDEPISPTETNPFRSPPANERDEPFDVDNQINSRLHGLGGVPENAPNHFNALSRGFGTGGFEGSDRSQTSSVGAAKPFPSLSGLGGLGGWPTSSNIGTPDRERSGFQAFGNSIFSSTGEMQSPSLAFVPSTGYGTAGRGSKLGSLFPAAMQAQMQGTENDQGDHSSEHRQASGFGTIGKNAFGMPSRDTDSPLRSGRNAFEDLFQPSNTREQQTPFASNDVFQAFTSAATQPSATAPAQSFSQFTSNQNTYQQSQASSDTSQLPQSQQRTMVMPDRMRWVYLDPQGQTQGPWSGLEMHDWYKASFFSADLSVKKVEDAEFEPLGQLIRRIGNSREPFLVPQIGIPHGPATTQPPPFTPAAVTPGLGGQPGSVQPPFAGSFPSFGTTLTAEQQNNLERRKQEEQYLMARQKEYLAAQQVNFKQMQMQGLPGALHHHSSAQSLQSQNSYSNMNMSSSMNLPTPGQLGSTNITGFFDHIQRNSVPSAAPVEYFREDELARLSISERQQLLNMTAASQQQHDQRQKQIAQMLTLKEEAEREQTRMDELRPADPQVFTDRLREFEQLRAQEPQEQISQPMASNAMGQSQLYQQHQAQQITSYQEEHRQLQPTQEEQIEEPRTLTLTEQVQKAASAKQTPQPLAQPESPWAKVQPGLPMPFPPPQSTTPLPAPTAQRGRSNLPEALNVESRSRSETPDMARSTPSLAPWAKEPAEAPKGPSLKEIQEIEAKKAAKVEELAMAARRAQLEQDLRNAQFAAVAPAPGLPTTSTWGASTSPNSLPAGVSSVWAKPVATKVHVPTVTSNKKTLADIQREEEARKQKVAAASAATATASHSATSLAGGKRYADLASKPMAPLATGGTAWSTVGAGGKVKIPTGPAASAPVQRTPITPTIAKVTKPATTTTRSGNPVVAGKQDGAKAVEELTKWAKSAVAKHLNPGFNGKLYFSFVNSLHSVMTLYNLVNPKAFSGLRKHKTIPIVPSDNLAFSLLPFSLRILVLAY